MPRAEAAAYRRLMEALEQLLDRHDPLGLDAPPGEYGPEAGSIAPRLAGARSVDSVRRIVHEEFVRWFDRDLAGAEEEYTVIAAEMWALVGRVRSPSSPHGGRPHALG